MRLAQASPTHLWLPSPRLPQRRPPQRPQLEQGGSWTTPAGPAFLPEAVTVPQEAPMPLQPLLAKRQGKAQVGEATTPAPMMGWGGNRRLDGWIHSLVDGVLQLRRHEAGDLLLLVRLRLREVLSKAEAGAVRTTLVLCLMCGRKTSPMNLRSSPFKENQAAAAEVVALRATLRPHRHSVDRTLHRTNHSMQGHRGALRPVLALLLPMAGGHLVLRSSACSLHRGQGMRTVRTVQRAQVATHRLRPGHLPLAHQMPAESGRLHQTTSSYKRLKRL